MARTGDDTSHSKIHREVECALCHDPDPDHHHHGRATMVVNTRAAVAQIVAASRRT